MANLSWPYIAGFFDGEGCIFFGESIQVVFSQSGLVGYEVLVSIQQFLKDNNINSILRTSVDNRYNHQPRRYSLCIKCNRDNVRLFLQKIIPFVHIKRTKAQDVLRFITLFPRRGGRTGEWIREGYCTISK